MTINIQKFNKVVADAKAKTNDPKWIRAIDRAAAAILSRELIVTLLGDRSLVTSANGSYWVNDGRCSCAAAKAGHQECYHRAAARLMDLYESAPEPQVPRVPRIVRSIERDYTGARCVVVRCDGWVI